MGSAALRDAITGIIDWGETVGRFGGDLPRATEAFGSLTFNDEVQKTRAPWSSPAWSFDRLRIDYRSPGEKPRWVLISPTDETRFIDDLAARTKSTLRREGDSLRRG